MSEHRLWLYLRDNMASSWEAQRHEDRLSTGIPDVSYSMLHHGWIELKYLAAAPKKASTPMRIEHYTTDQRNWIMRHGSRGGLVFLLLQVGRDYLLFDWTRAREIGQVTFAEHCAMAAKHWAGRINWSELSYALNQPIRRQTADCAEPP
jgi:hypothetical protein